MKITEKVESAKEIYARALDLLEDHTRWTRGVDARTLYGQAVPYTHPDAYSFSALGAIRRAASEQDTSPVCAARWMYFILTMPPRDISYSGYLDGWNQQAVYSQIIAGFQSAISSLRNDRAERHPIFTGERW